MTLQDKKRELIAGMFRTAEAEHANLFADALLEEVAIRAKAIINARLQSAAIARDRAKAAGREGVSDCRQSDVETCERLMDELASAIRLGKGK